MTLSSDEHQRWYRRIRDVLHDVNAGFIQSSADAAYEFSKVRQDMKAVGHPSITFNVIRCEVFKKEPITYRAHDILKPYLFDN